MKGLRFYTPIAGPTGYVSFGVGIAEELNKITNVGLVPLDSPPQPDRFLSRNLMSALFAVETLPRDVPAIILSMGGKMEFLRGTGTPLIAYNMWESDRPPATFVNALKDFDEVWVPSKWGAECYQKAGVEKARAMPGGVNPYLYNDMQPKIPDLVAKKTFKFLAVGKWERRKGYDLLLKAFAETFKPEEPVELHLVAHNIFVPNFDIWREIEALQIGKRPPLFCHQVPTNQLMASLYSSVDAFCLPTRGEGFNMPLAEAMSTGLPCITPLFGGHSEFANDTNTFVVPHEIVPAKNDVYWQKNFEGSNWAEPDYKTLCEQMRYVFEHQDEARKKGAKAAEDIRANFTTTHAAKRIVARLKELEV